MKKTMTALLTWIPTDPVKRVRKPYPSRLNANEIVYSARKTAPSKRVVADHNKLRFVIFGQKEHDAWGDTFRCYLENKSDQTLLFAWDDAGLNECMADPFFAKAIAPSMRCYCEIGFSSSDLEENGIADVEEIEYCIRVYDFT